jgi:hypothetical protein
LPDLLRRVAALTALSALGIALLAPLAARSAAEPPVAPIDHLLPKPALPALDIDRGGLLSARIQTDGAFGGAAPETLEDAAIPAPESVAMEATLVAEATPAPPTAAAPAAPQPVVTYDGDTVWDALAQCESGGNWAINTGNGYYGGLQFSYGTWLGYGGGEFAEYAHLATREQQIIVAERLHAARGFQPWPACRVKLGLP